MPPKRVKKVMTVPINVIFGHLQVRFHPYIRTFVFVNSHHSFLLQKKTRVRFWIYEDKTTFIEGIIIGFDEYMNMVVDEATEINKSSRKEVGRILLKGDAITLLQYVCQTRHDINTNNNKSHDPFFSFLLFSGKPNPCAVRTFTIRF